MPESISAPVLQMQAMTMSKGIRGMKEHAATGQLPALEKDSRELKNACAEFESLFIFQLLKEMRAAIPKSGFLSGGRGKEIYTSMFDAQVARELASERGLGLSSMLMERFETKNVAGQKNMDKEQKNAKVIYRGNR